MSPGTKTALSTPVTAPAAYKWYALATDSVQQQRMTPLRICVTAGGDFGGLCAVYVW